ncbi:acyl--CoA ligase [Sphingobium sp. PNB]|uniref:class I adenylate-forming enzyme family protein n=1 Tax=Sphingobium sp. PNB TaxID=863934 RepID=UPI001CA3C3CB|nr:class I adenylate-forming enzyme family protein [Sphingobium sp. PNB]MCB4858451.1 acyl--CoA ligase [Sphingobium sp. PNB]
MPVLAHFLEIALARPGSVAFFWGDKRWTNGDLLAEIDALVDALVDAGAQTGDRISISMPNSPNLAISLLACLRGGFVAAPINTRFKAEETRAVVDLIAPALHLGSAGASADLSGVCADTLPSDARVVLADEGGAAEAVRGGHCRRGDSTRSSAPGVAEPAILMATSGTTGAPKIVTHTLGTLDAITARYDALGLRPDDIMLNVGPMVHAGGLFNFLASLVRPSAMVMVGPFEPGAVLDAIARHRCTWMKALPFIFAELIDAQRLHPRDISSLRFCVASGDAAPTRLKQGFASTFRLPLHAGWASTEAATSLVHCAAEGSGYPIRTGTGVTLRSIEGDAADVHDTGELLVCGPHVSPGYWSNGAVQPGPDYFETGDVFQRLADGTLAFVERRKNLIIRGGSNISPLEVEEALRAYPDVSDAAVFGIPDDRLGERIAALIELAPSASASVAEILRRLRERLSDYKIPEFARVVSRLPRNGNGKVDRAALPRLLSEQPALATAGT